MKSRLIGTSVFLIIKIFLASLIATVSLNAYARYYYVVDEYDYYYYDCPRTKCYDCYRPCEYAVCDHFSYKSHYRKAPKTGVAEMAEYEWYGDP